MQKPSPPRDLSDPARTLWRRLRDDYTIDDPCGLHYLEVAMRAFDRMQDAQRHIAAHGIVVEDRFHQMRANPATVIERDSRSGMLLALKALRLDIEALGPVGRPAGR